MIAVTCTAALPARDATELLRVMRISINSPAVILDRLEHVTEAAGLPVRRARLLDTMLAASPSLLKAIDLDRPIAGEYFLRRRDLPHTFEGPSFGDTDVALAFAILTTPEEFLRRTKLAGEPVRGDPPQTVVIPIGDKELPLKFAGRIAYGATDPGLAARLDPAELLGEPDG